MSQTTSKQWAQWEVGTHLSFFPVYRKNHNTAWINYIWYNEQHFINYSIWALGLIRDQLHATSLMAAQNRFVLDQMHASEKGVCTMIGPESCAAIPLHSGAHGALIHILDRLNALQEEHVCNSGFSPHLPSWLSWMLSGDWAATLTRLGVTLFGIHGILALTICCVIPLGRCFALTAVTSVSNISGQYVIIECEASLNHRGEVHLTELSGTDSENETVHIELSEDETFAQRVIMAQPQRT